MGSNRVNNINEIDAATVRLIRLIVVEAKRLDAEGFNNIAESNRRFASRVVDAASEAAKDQLKIEGTWI